MDALRRLEFGKTAPPLAAMLSKAETIELSKFNEPSTLHL